MSIPTPDKAGKVSVLCGGPSAEREISIQSGTAVCEALCREGFDAQLLELPAESTQIPALLDSTTMDCAFVVLHGPFGEDGQIQALLEERQIPYTGSCKQSCERSMDKQRTRELWQDRGLPVPEGQLLLLQDLQAQTDTIDYPIMIKPLTQGSSIGMSLVKQAQDLPEAITAAAPYGDHVLVERFIEGPELTVGILDDQPLPVIQLVPKREFYDHIAKYTPGMTDYLVPAPIPEDQAEQAQQLAIQAHRALGCHVFSRVDLIWGSQGPVLLEVNTIPGMTQLSLLPKAAAFVGISFDALCVRMLASAFVPSMLR